MWSKTSQPRKAPQPHGVLSGKRTVLRRCVAIACAAINRGLDRLPFTHWMHARIRDSLQVPELDRKLRPGHESLDGLRIAFISDVHAGSFLNAADLEAIFQRVQDEEPDLVLFGGDLINTRDREIVLFREGLRRLRPRYGVYAVPGNHDHFLSLIHI